MLQRKAVRRVRSRRSWAVRFLLIALFAFLFLKAVQLFGQIQEQQNALSTLDGRIATQNAKNEELSVLLEQKDDSLEQKANEDGYGLPGQQFYQSEAG